jgi:hypothetical protein
MAKVAPAGVAVAVASVVRIAIVGGVFALAACGAHYRYEPAGRAPAVIGEAPPGAGVPVRAGVRHDVVIRVSTPRAEIVAWELVCPGDTEKGTVGETMDAYRTRRLAELRRERDRERNAAASIGGAIGGAVLGRVGASGAVQTPAGAGAATVQVDGAAVGAAAGAATVSDDVQLAPGDVGAGTYVAKVSITPGTDGACTVAIAPDDGGDPVGIGGDFDVTRVIDRDREARAHAAVLVGQARDVRVSVQASLVADGADAGLRARLRAEADARAQADAAVQARLHAEAEARVQAQADAQARIVAEVNGRAWSARAGMIAWLSSCGGDPYRRQREREEQARVREEQDRRAQLAREEQWRREQAARDEDARREQMRRDADARRAQLAVGVRNEQIAMLVSEGAVVRPPMPPAPDENPGAAPAGQVWIAGHWEWDAPQWIWIGGGWSASEAAGAAVEASATAVPVEPVIVIAPTPPPVDAGAGTRTVDHRTTTTPPPVPPTRTVDHRSESHPATTTTTSAPRDHRDEPAKDPRDHRH